MRVTLFRTLVFVAVASIATSAAMARTPPPPKRFGAVIQPDGIEFRESCKGAQPFEHCKMYTKSYARPRLLKRHGVVYGVRDLDFTRDCRGYPPGDGCITYRATGTILNLEADEHRIVGFDLRMAGGRMKYQNILTPLPALAERLLRNGRRVRVSGTITGQGRIANVDEIVVERLR